MNLISGMPTSLIFMEPIQSWSRALLKMILSQFPLSTSNLCTRRWAMIVVNTRASSWGCQTWQTSSSKKDIILSWTFNSFFDLHIWRVSILVGLIFVSFHAARACAFLDQCMLAPKPGPLAMVQTSLMGELSIGSASTARSSQPLVTSILAIPIVGNHADRRSSHTFLTLLF